ncbi:hypothetical protein THOM_1731 [Trachipleistophora hominis]|uniref:Uncharacterized protein n=1 Tax=Trachipleistophora hominis TaxID=72359 RepID=L7JVL7_TRAHO|nr:hypothetical protein THOM_1731 [Trachipleistophora hominis]
MFIGSYLYAVVASLPYGQFCGNEETDCIIRIEKDEYDPGFEYCPYKTKLDFLLSCLLEQIANLYSEIISKEPKILEFLQFTALTEAKCNSKSVDKYMEDLLVNIKSKHTFSDHMRRAVKHFNRKNGNRPAIIDPNASFFYFSRDETIDTLKYVTTILGAVLRAMKRSKILDNEIFTMLVSSNNNWYKDCCSIYTMFPRCESVSIPANIFNNYITNHNKFAQAFDKFLEKVFPGDSLDKLICPSASKINIDETLIPESHLYNVSNATERHWDDLKWNDEKDFVERFKFILLLLPVLLFLILVYLFR